MQFPNPALLLAGSAVALCIFWRKIKAIEEEVHRRIYKPGDKMTAAMD